MSTNRCTPSEAPGGGEEKAVAQEAAGHDTSGGSAGVWPERGAAPGGLKPFHVSALRRLEVNPRSTASVGRRFGGISGPRPPYNPQRPAPSCPFPRFSCTGEYALPISTTSIAHAGFSTPDTDFPMHGRQVRHCGTPDFILTDSAGGPRCPREFRFFAGSRRIRCSAGHTSALSCAALSIR